MTIAMATVCEPPVKICIRKVLTERLSETVSVSLVVVVVETELVTTSLLPLPLLVSHVPALG